MSKKLKTLWICNIKSIRWTKLKKTAIFEKKIIHKVLDHLKSNFDHEYFKSEKRFWYAVFFSWSILIPSIFRTKISRIKWQVFELGRKNLIFWYKIAYKKKSRVFPEKPPCEFLALIVMNLHEKNQENRWSRFWENLLIN